MMMTALLLPTCRLHLLDAANPSPASILLAMPFHHLLSNSSWRVGVATLRGTVYLQRSSVKESFEVCAPVGRVVVCEQRAVAKQQTQRLPAPPRMRLHESWEGVHSSGGHVTRWLVGPPPRCASCGNVRRPLVIASR